MRYITVTLNPTVDRLYRLSEPIHLGTLNRASEMSRTVYSGKGINVSRELLRLGVDSKVLCILRGNEGKAAFDSMVKEELNLFPVMAEGRLRQNISILDVNGLDTEINEPGDEIEMKDVLKFLSLYDKTISEPGQRTLFLCGSTPPGFRDDIYKRMVLQAKEKGAYVILDADEMLLKYGLEGKPNLIKPNEKELFSLTGKKLSGDESQMRMEALAAASMIFDNTGTEVLCTLGAKGSVFAGRDGQFVCPAKIANIKRFKGAGDMYLARFVYERFERKKSVFDAMKTASEKTARNLAELEF